MESFLKIDNDNKKNIKKITKLNLKITKYWKIKLKNNKVYKISRINLKYWHVKFIIDQISFIKNKLNKNN